MYSINHDTILTAILHPLNISREVDQYTFTIGYWVDKIEISVTIIEEVIYIHNSTYITAIHLIVLSNRHHNNKTRFNVKIIFI